MLAKVLHGARYVIYSIMARHSAVCATRGIAADEPVLEVFDFQVITTCNDGHATCYISTDEAVI
jgi:hypothetical protein